jgi:hypothetical protein
MGAYGQQLGMLIAFLFVVVPHLSIPIENYVFDCDHVTRKHHLEPKQWPLSQPVNVKCNRP